MSTCTWPKSSACPSDTPAITQSLHLAHPGAEPADARPMQMHSPCRHAVYRCTAPADTQFTDMQPVQEPARSFHCKLQKGGFQSKGTMAFGDLLFSLPYQENTSPGSRQLRHRASSTSFLCMPICFFLSHLFEHKIQKRLKNCLSFLFWVLL